MPCRIFCLFAIKSNADPKKEPIHGVQLIENIIPNNIVLKNVKSSIFFFILFSLFKNFILSIPI